MQDYRTSGGADLRTERSEWGVFVQAVPRGAPRRPEPRGRRTSSPGVVGSPLLSRAVWPGELLCSRWFFPVPGPPAPSLARHGLATRPAAPARRSHHRLRPGMLAVVDWPHDAVNPFYPLKGQGNEAIATDCPPPGRRANTRLTCAGVYLQTQCGAGQATLKYPQFRQDSPEKLPSQKPVDGRSRGGAGRTSPQNYCPS